MIIEHININDIESISNLQPEDWLDIRPNFDFYVKSAFCYPIKVLEGDKIVGIGTNIIHNDIAWLAHIVVHQDYRNKGIGLLITKFLVNSLNAQGIKTIYLIATELGAPVYEKLGFITETDYLFFKDINLKITKTTKNIKPYRQDFKEQIGKIDRENSSEDRMFHIENHIQNSYFYSKNNIVEGFYLPTFGQGLIIANTTTAGLELLKLHLKTNEILSFPKDNTNATNFLFKNGIEAFMSAKRMRLGEKRVVKFENIYSRIGGNLG